MAALKDTLKSDLTTSMKARDELRTATLRMVLTAIGMEEVAGKAARALSDDEELKVLGREAKKRREAAAAFRAGGAEDRAQREVDEEKIIQAYLPAQLSDSELATLAAAAVRSSGASGPQAMGAVMKVLSPQIAGKADGGRVAAAVRAALGS